MMKMTTQKRDKKVCPKCGVELELIVFYNFGDPNLGVRDEYLKCPHCNYFTIYEQHRRDVEAT